MKKVIFYFITILCLLLFQKVNSQENDLRNIQSEIKETLINYHLCYYIDCSESKNILSYLPYNRVYYDETSINELLKILENVWEEQEKELITKKVVLNSIENKKGAIENLLEDTVNFNISKRRRNILKFQLDSLNKLDLNSLDSLIQYVSECNKIKLDIENYKVPDEIIILSGYLCNSKFIPVLKRALNDSLRYNTFLVNLALSRFQIEPYHTRTIEMIISKLDDSNFKNIDYYQANQLYDYSRSNLLYINSQKSVKEFSKLLKLPAEISSALIDSHDDVGFIPLPFIVLEDLLVIIKNEDFRIYFIEKYNKKKLNASMFKSEDIEYAIKWLEMEYGNYILDRDFFPGNIK